MPDQDKSVLDGLPVDNKAFPLQGVGSCNKSPPSSHLVVLSSCPQCGAPIYGNRQVDYGEFPVVQYSCTCTPPPVRQKSILDSMETK